MNYIKKMLLIVVVLIAMLLFIPNMCNAANASVSNEQTLEEAITKVNAGQIDSITLTNSITVTGPLTEITKNVTIEGKGFTISGDDNWYKNGGSGNQSIITSTDGILTLKNLILKHGPKQGAQAYGNGTLVLDGVTISDCKYSGLISNGGTIEIRDLNLNTNAGIEVGKSTTNPVNNNPKIVMNGTLKSISKALIYEDAATKSKLTIENKESSKNKLFVTESSVLITDNNNNIIYETQNLGNIDIQNSDMAEENFVTVTIKYDDKTKKFVVTKNEKLSKYNLSDIKNIEGKVFDHFVKSDNEVFSEDTPITTNIELTAVYRVAEEPTPTTPKVEAQSSNGTKDVTPKTGVTDYLGLALVTLAMSTVLLVVVKRKF